MSETSIVESKDIQHAADELYYSLLHDHATATRQLAKARVRQHRYVVLFRGPSPAALAASASASTASSSTIPHWRRHKATAPLTRAERRLVTYVLQYSVPWSTYSLHPRCVAKMVLDPLVLILARAYDFVQVVARDCLFTLQLIPKTNHAKHYCLHIPLDVFEPLTSDSEAFDCALHLFHNAPVAQVWFLLTSESCKRIELCEQLYRHAINAPHCAYSHTSSTVESLVREATKRHCLPLLDAVMRVHDEYWQQLHRNVQFSQFAANFVLDAEQKLASEYTRLHDESKNVLRAITEQWHALCRSRSPPLSPPLQYRWHTDLLRRQCIAVTRGFDCLERGTLETILAQKVRDMSNPTAALRSVALWHAMRAANAPFGSDLELTSVVCYLVPPCVASLLNASVLSQLCTLVYNRKRALASCAAENCQQ